MISLIFSTPVFDAASISIISKAFPSVICLHMSHLQQGFIVGSLNAWQFKDFANILALDVFPVPLGPLKRYAGAIFFVNNACFKVIDINFWPTSSSKLLGLYF